VLIDRRAVALVVLVEGDAVMRIYKCPSCTREMRLTVWAPSLGSEGDEADGVPPGFSA
jgi:hypothetical protein